MVSIFKLGNNGFAPPKHLASSGNSPGGCSYVIFDLAGNKPAKVFGMVEFTASVQFSSRSKMMHSPGALRLFCASVSLSCGTEAMASFYIFSFKNGSKATPSQLFLLPSKSILFSSGKNGFNGDDSSVMKCRNCSGSKWLEAGGWTAMSCSKG